MWVVGQCLRMCRTRRRMWPARLRAARRLAGAQQHGDRSAGCRVVDVDRQKAALAVMPVPERQLLVAVHDIAGVIDVQRHRLGRGWIAGAIDVDHRGHQLRQLARGRCVLPAAHRRLTGKTRARTRQLAQRQAKAGIVTQRVEVVGILVAAGNRQNPRPQDVIQLVDHPRRIARIGNAGGQLRADPHLALGLRQEQNAAVRSEPATVESSCDFLASDRWESKRACDIVVHGGCSLWHFLSRSRDGLDTQFLTSEQSLTLLPPTVQTPPCA